MKTLKSEEAITILEDMKVNISIPKAEVTQIKRNAALNMAIDALSNQNESSEQADHIADDSKMVDQFREATKKTEDVPDIHVGKTDFKPEPVTDCHNLMDDSRRQDAIDALERIFDRCEEIEAHLPEGDPDRVGYKMYPDWLKVWKYLRQVPSAQPERKTGRWIYGEDDVAMCDGYHCSECGFFVPWDYKHKFIDFIKDYNFCPNCGAIMRGGQDD